MLLKFNSIPEVGAYHFYTPIGSKVMMCKKVTENPLLRKEA